MSKQQIWKTDFKVTHEAEAYVDTYVKAIADRTAPVHAGAGLSIPAGLIDWRGPLREIASEGQEIQKIWKISEKVTSGLYTKIKETAEVQSGS